MAFLSTVKQLIHINRVFAFNKIPLNTLLNCIRDTLVSANITKLNSKILIGVLIDKPIYVLLYKNKLNFQKIYSLNESFLYPPYRSFDYNYLDKYYSMNQIDEEMINRFGGLVKEFKRVSFYRKNLKSISDGISEELRINLSKFKNMILACPVQIGVSEFFWYDKKDLDIFLDSIISIADKFKETLIVIKGKKNELSYAHKDVLSTLNQLNNVYIVDSVKPKLLKHNQFEDLIEKASILLSINSGSTTIWQAYANYKPVVILNESHKKCWLSNYEYIEVNSTNLAQAIKYWLDMKEIKRNQFIDKIIDVTNMGSFDGLKDVASDIEHSLSLEN